MSVSPSTHTPLSPSAPHDPPSSALPLRDLVASADALLHDQPDGALLRVSGDPPKLQAWPLGDDDHPLDHLLGFTAPPSWQAIGLRCRGRGIDLDEPPDGAPPDVRPGAAEARPVTVTILIDRSGRGDGLMRAGSDVRHLAGLPEGAVGDACRRALGLPTAPPPASTAVLWLHVWIDRIVEALACAPRPGGITWDVAAGLHPSGHHGVGARPAPEAVAEATERLAEAWPWDRLRRDPEVVDTARPPLRRTVTDWMDGGMFARWLLTELVDLRLLAETARAGLDPAVVALIARTFHLCGITLPPAEVSR